MSEGMGDAQRYIPQRPRLGLPLLRRKMGETLRAFHFKLWLVNIKAWLTSPTVW